MSWLNRVKDKLVIETGDGEKYTPLWVAASSTFNEEYNTTEFEFVNLAGTLVDRRLPKGARYNLEVCFDGDDHIDIAAKFRKSAANPKYWTLTHPYYGLLFVQPLSFGQDNSSYNVTKIVIPIVETIVTDAPKSTVDILDSITITKLNLDDELEQSITAEITPTDINTITQQNKTGYNLSVPIITLPEEFQDYFNLFNQANAAVDTATASPLLAMRATISLITAPGKFTNNVQTRLNLLISQYNTLRQTLSSILSPSAKQVYQVLGATILSTMALSVTTPLNGDFSNGKKVGKILKDILRTYNNLLADLDSIQTPNGGSPLSFIPDFPSLLLLDDLINTTTGYLEVAIISARKEREFICTEDTNIILLAHRFYGLDENDNNINELIENNDLSLLELVQIKKGRKIIYYI